MAGNSGGPWGGGGSGGGNRGNNGSGGGSRGPGGPRRPGGDQQIPEIDEIVRKGQEQLRVLMGGRGGRNGGDGGSGGGDGFKFTRGTFGIAALLVIGLWAFNSFYTVRPEEQSVELFLGEFSSIGNPGLNFAPWPLVTAEVLAVTRENSISIGTNRPGASSDGLMLTTDENIVDIDFEVVWNISDPALYLFNLRDPEATIRAVSEASMREVISASQLAPILNRDRAIIAESVRTLIQETLDSYDSGVNIVRLNLDRADPPEQVIDAFREVQAAEQERDRLENVRPTPMPTAFWPVPAAKPPSFSQEAEAYRAQVVNEAQGEASRFLAVLQEYEQAPDVTRRRLYLETMERVLGDVDLVILDGEGGAGGSGVVPYLPLNELRRGTTGTGTTTTTGSSN
jgi:membrane protease subunit HflK